MTALMFAACYGQSEMTKVLIDADASIEAKNNVSKTIFIFSYIYVCVCVDKFILPSYCMM